MLFYLENLPVAEKTVSLQCVFHSIRFKVNKGWSKALLLFLCLYVSECLFSAFSGFSLFMLFLINAL